MNKVDRDIANLPDTTVSVKEKFGFESKMVVPAYSAATEHVPDFDPDYLFDQQTTLAIRARVPLDVLRDTIQPFPTFSEIYMEALKALQRRITR